MTKKLKVKDRRNYYRDAESKAIIINDPSGLNKAKELKRRLNIKEERFNKLESEMKDLKELLAQLTEKINGNS